MLYKCLILFFACLGFLSSALHAQYDSFSKEELKKELKKETDPQKKHQLLSVLTTKYMRIDTDSMLMYAEKLRDFASYYDNDQYWVSAFYQLGRYYAVKGDSDNAIKNLQEAYERIDIVEDLSFKGKIIGMMGYVYYFDAQYEVAINFYEESIEYFKEAKDKQAEAIAISTVGSIWYQRGEYDIAKSKYLESLAIKEQLNDSILMSTDISNIGIIYKNQGKLDSALVYTLRALEIDESLNNISGMSGAYGDLASIYLELSEFKEAIEFAEKSLQMAQRVNSLHQIKDSYEELYQVYKAWGKSEEALENHESFKAYSDSILNSETRWQLVDAQQKYESEEKAQSIKLLEAENLAVRFQVTLIIVFGLALFIIVSFIFWIVNRQRAEKRKNELFSVQRELENFGTLIAEKDSFISQVVEKLKMMRNQLKSSESRKELYKLIQDIEQNVDITDSEEHLFSRIEQVNKGFFMALEAVSNSLTKSDRRLASLIQMDLSNKEISSILHINTRSVVQARYRLKKKLKLTLKEDLVIFLRNLGK